MVRLITPGEGGVYEVSRSSSSADVVVGQGARDGERESEQREAKHEHGDCGGVRN